MADPDEQPRGGVPTLHSRQQGAPRSALPALAAVLLGAAVALLAQFPLESVADSSDLGHWLQHALLFWSGISVGLGLLALYRRAKERP